LRRLHFSLATQILTFQVGIVLGAVALGALASLWLARSQLDERYMKRSLGVAESVASMPSVRDALHDSDPARTLQPLAEGLRRASGAKFVVITDRAGIRYSHPNPAMIGKPIDENPTAALSGRPWVGIETGTLGRSVRGKAPIFDGDGKVIGIVSVGFLEQDVSAQLAQELPQIFAYLAVALALGLAGSLLLARRLKRQTFGLEPREIVALLEQREASLHGIREGTIATDRQGRITFANDEAHRLLALPEGAVGRRLLEVVPPGRMREVLAGDGTQTDQVVLARDRVLVANRMPVAVRGETIGSVVTFRDRTELESLVRELNDARSLTEALRAQAHEFSNRLHTIAGLIELGRLEDAMLLSTQSSGLSQEVAESLLKRVGNPMLGALLLSKAALASERGIDFQLSADTLLDRDVGDPNDLITIVGNLVDNAFDAVYSPSASDGRRVEVSIQTEGDILRVAVQDSGPGVPLGLERDVFTEGFSTKSDKTEGRHGLGLALVRQVVIRRGGEISVANHAGALFRVRLPLRSPSRVS
jgi:two-component system CitB family sensor kinase